MSTKVKILRRLIRHPLVIIPPLVALLVVGWQHYTYAGRDLSLPSAGNLLPSSFSAFDASGTPAGWTISKSGDSAYQTASDTGYTGSSAFSITVSNYRSGDITLASPKTTVQPGKTYLFKGYYAASMPFALLARYFDGSGNSTLRLVRTYPAAANVWTTASDAFLATPNITAVQFVYRVYANGQLQLDSPYLEPQTDVYIAPPKSGNNTVPNSSLDSGNYNAPLGWSTYQSGDNTAAFSYQLDPAGNYVQTRVASYKNGQAKWQYTPQPATANQYYQVQLEYRSDVSVPLVAEYTLAADKRQDQTITELPPAAEWTTATFEFQTIPGAAGMFVTLPLEHAGTVASRHYAVTDITRAGAAQWSHPIVSIAFDDGWQQAYQTALPILTEYGFNATFYVTPSTIETAGFMSAGELAALKSAGNEIGSQGFEHTDMTAVNRSAIDYQLRKGRDYLRAAGFAVSDAAAPYGRSDAEVQWYARKYFTTLRGTDFGLNTRQAIDPYDLRVLPIDTQTTSKTIAAALQQAKDYNGWLILLYHQVGAPAFSGGTSAAESADTSPAGFKQDIDLIHASGLRVLPVAAAYQALENP